METSFPTTNDENNDVVVPGNDSWILQLDDEVLVDAMVNSSIEKATVICSQIAGLVSFASGLCIFLETGYDQCYSGSNNSRNRQRANITTRILLSWSVGTMAFSLGCLMGTWPIQSYYSDLIWAASGNDRTCTLQGVLISMGMLIAALWDMALSLTFVFVVPCNWSQRRLDLWEMCLHGFIWPLVLGVTIAALVLQSFNTDRDICFLIAAPYLCDSDGDKSDCNRGLQAYGFELLVYLSIILGVVVGLLSMIILYRFVLKQELKNERYLSQFKESTNSVSVAASETNVAGDAGAASNTCVVGNGSTEIQTSTVDQQQRQLKLSRQVAIQGILYGCVWLLSAVPAIVVNLVHEFVDTWNDPAYLFSQVFGTLYGFWYLLVFLRSRETMKTCYGRFVRYLLCYFCNRRNNANC